MIGQPQLAETARRLGISLVVTHSDEPVGAATAVGANLGALARHVAPGAVVLVLADGVRVLSHAGPASAG